MHYLSLPSYRLQGPHYLFPEPISLTAHFYLCDFLNKLSLIVWALIQFFLSQNSRTEVVEARSNTWCLSCCQQYVLYPQLISFFKRFYLFIFREGKEERKRGRETSVCGCFSHASDWGPGPQPRHVLWPGIEPASLWFAVWCWIHWATLAWALINFLIYVSVAERHILYFSTEYCSFFLNFLSIFF